MTNQAQKYQPRTFSDKRLKQNLKRTISSFGEFSFSDDSWYYSELHGGSAMKGTCTITFHKVPLIYRDTVKYYALLNPGNPGTTQKKVLKIADFLIMLSEKFEKISIQCVSYRHVNAYEQYLMLSDDSWNTKSFSYSAIQDFFIKIADLVESPFELPVKQINPFRQTRRFAEEKYIPKSATKKLDTFFQSNSVVMPVAFRLLYWMLRSFPNRVNEVLSMKVDCISQLEDLYFLEIPMYKQKGPTARPEIKRIPVTNVDHGKYIIDLVRQVKLQQKELIKIGHVCSATLNENLLFITESGHFGIKGGKITFIAHNTKHHILNMSLVYVNNRLRELCKLLDLRDTQSHPLQLTSHYFRHNAITDRLYVPNYTQEQIMKLTGHKNERMIQNYTHERKDIHKQLAQNADKVPLTLARIIEFNAATTSYLSTNENCYGLSEVNSEKGLGICEDIDNCKRDGTPFRFCCYFCPWFRPNKAYLPAYEKELTYWQVKLSTVESSDYSGKLTIDQVTQIRDKLTVIIKVARQRGEL
ncbi:tyrosine-type recombinase/integrase [Lactiplantibacillus sp. WILCCON 0030]|uniref:Tyrosine-type recombinase/integrase n=1 Tax=Lactiplantibacillus brownii TaxID=3069269 RepID=A0ABU1ABD3_9LACO|nr:tyrosine-type recombinase/integrase [Lactiplantibacillus brownii]MDQ7938230.1 tyrosine-type recombinase/integrase [Lactiplantibacillus brownii]